MRSTSQRRKKQAVGASATDKKRVHVGFGRKQREGKRSQNMTQNKILNSNIEVSGTENELFGLLLGLKSLEYLLNVFDVLEGNEHNFYSQDMISVLQRFALQCFYCEKVKNHPVFQHKIFHFPWSTLQNVIAGRKSHPYLNDLLEIVDGVVDDFSDPELDRLGLREEEKGRFLSILFDFLLTLIVEIYSKIHSCSMNGRFQMKMDLQEIFHYIEPLLPQHLGNELIEKFRNFVEVYWYNSPKGSFFNFKWIFGSTKKTPSLHFESNSLLFL